MRFRTFLFCGLVLVPRFVFAQDCEPFKEYSLEAYLCECAAVENDIERLACYDREALREKLKLRQATSLAEILGEKKYGSDAMKQWLEGNE